MAVNIPADSRIVTRGRVVIGPHSFGMSAVGGDIVQDISLNGITYRTHTFTGSGILTVTTGPSGTGTIEYLLVGGGGGGGGAGPNGSSGGGGAGGFITGSIILTVSGPYTITLGNGGPFDTNGSNTTFGSPLQPSLLLAYGGGRGGSPISNALPGGSGGGASATPSANGPVGTSLFSQGNPGAPGGQGGFQNQQNWGGSGGGAGSPGVSAGSGGNARETFISGFPQWYAAGGGGSTNYTNVAGNGGVGGIQVLGGRATTFNGPAPINGVDNTGSGGGGGGGFSGVNGGSGGRGIAIIRYRIS